MSELDDIFKNPLPKVNVHKGLFGLFVNDCVMEAQAEMWSEDELKRKLTDAHAYLAFLNRLNNAVVQEISDVDNQIEPDAWDSN